MHSSPLLNNNSGWKPATREERCFGRRRPTDECRHGPLLPMKRGPACVLLIWCLELMGLRLSLQKSLRRPDERQSSQVRARLCLSVKLLGWSFVGRLKPNMETLSTSRSAGVLRSRGFSRVPTSPLLCGWREVKGAATYTLVQVPQTPYLTHTLAETERTHSLRHDNQLIWIRCSDGQGSQAEVTEKLTPCIWMRSSLQAYRGGGVFIISPFLNV